MIQRCHNPENANYYKYGAIGRTVCEEWRNSFMAFYIHIGPRPSMAHSIDRFPNNNGNYEPGNVRWATASEQTINTGLQKGRLIKGVARANGVWGAYVSRNKKRTYLYHGLDYFEACCARKSWDAKNGNA